MCVHVCVICILTGKEDQLQPIDVPLWTASMMSESRPPPPLCPTSFKSIALRIIQNNFHLNIADITHSNCRDIYLLLVHHLEALVLDGTLRL